MRVKETTSLLAKSIGRNPGEVARQYKPAVYLGGEAYGSQL